MFGSHNEKVNVLYYRLKADTPQYEAALMIHEEACNFVKVAQAFADSKGADGWTYTYDSLAYAREKEPGEGWSGYRISSLRYIDEKRVPDDWKGDQLGLYNPGSSADRSTFKDIKIPVRNLICDEGFALSFHVFSDQILVATQPNKDGTRPNIRCAEPLERSVVDVILEEASEQDKKGFALDSGDWSILDSALAVHYKHQSPTDDARLTEAEDKRFHSRNSEYVPNPTTGVRGLARRALNLVMG